MKSPEIITIVKTIHDLMIGHLRIDWSISELCENYGIVRSAFDRNFKGLYGATPKAYFRRKKFIQMRKTLLTTKRSIRSVIADYDIASEQGFGRQYKLLFGETTSETLKATRHVNGKPKV